MLVILKYVLAQSIRWVVTLICCSACIDMEIHRIRQCCVLSICIYYYWLALLELEIVNVLISLPCDSFSTKNSEVTTCCSVFRFWLIQNCVCINLFTCSFLQKETWRHSLILSFQTLGVVYGRLSTAPLYVFGTIQTTDFKSNETAYEYFSFIFWTLTVVSLLKYAFIVLRADDNGEGNDLW